MSIGKVAQVTQSLLLPLLLPAPVLKNTNTVISFQYKISQQHAYAHSFPT